ncbi:MAG: hypothetical protein PHN26_05575 [Eubacteriaceae bacterium]|nr:hypothetical protein [Eubacteriaceae bacterium]
MVRIKGKVVVLAVLACLLWVAPVFADETQNLTNVSPSGSTDVTGQVQNNSPGNVSYIVTVPKTVDFGTLQQPADVDSDHNKDLSFMVTAKEVNNLTSGQIAVLMKDGTEDGSDNFRIQGSDTVNSGKSLAYKVYNSATPDNDIQTGTKYNNGYLLGTLKQTGDTVNGILRLNQNQLFAQDLTTWAGNYKGTITFYSTITGIPNVNNNN